MVTFAHGPNRACFFKLGDQSYAVEGQNVRQVVTVRALTRVPRTPKILLGLFAERGQLLPLINLKALLKLSSSRSDAYLALIITTPSGLLALNVDLVIGFQPFRGEDLQAKPAPYVKAVLQDGENTTGFLDITQIEQDLKQTLTTV